MLCYQYKFNNTVNMYWCLIFCTIVTKVRVGCADSECEVERRVTAQSPLPNNRSLTHTASSGPRPIPPDQLKCNILKGKLISHNIKYPLLLYFFLIQKLG